MTIEDVLWEFVNDIESAGGLERDAGPAGEPGWTDLGVTYLHACEVLGRKPVYVDAEEDDEFVDPYYTGIEEEPTEPEDDDLVTDNYVRFYRHGFRHKGPAVTVPEGEEWEPHVKAYMEKEQFWPNLWVVDERAGYTNITTEGP